MFLLLISIFALFLPLVFVFISWLIHLEMTKEYTEIYGYGDYKKFINNFDKNGLVYNKGFDSFFNFQNDSEFHAGIIKFKGIGMLLNPIDWIRANMYVDKTVKILNKKKIYNW